jgi:DNA-binding response OmpR family regulator
MTQNTVLLIGENERNSQIHESLDEEGYQVIAGHDAARILEMARQESADLIILDSDTMDEKSNDICRLLREATDAPILVIADNSDDSDIVIVLEGGADSYLAKPFGIRELTARVKALLRRTRLIEQSRIENKPEKPGINIGELIIHPDSHLVHHDGATVRLTRMEYNLLSFLVTNRGVAFSREQLLEKVWDNEFDGYARTVDAHIWSLRQKLEENPHQPVHLLAVRGFGYKFV